ncbi:MAG: aspartate kinase, partial [Clostridia bacterium]
MSTAESIERVAEIILSDKDRKYIVVSAPGKRFRGDNKVTDLLYASFDEALETGSCKNSFSKVRERFLGLVSDLKLSVNFNDYLDEIEANINASSTPDYAASRGEFLAAMLLAAKLRFGFVDASDLIRFAENGAFNAEYTNDIASKNLEKCKYVVVPGFYGSFDNGQIKTFSRGGSDVSGAIVARAVNADVYENWTDVDGFLTADPRIVDNPKQISTLSYSELRELSYMGADVLHPDSIFPVRISQTPINIRNTFFPEHAGTTIVARYEDGCQSDNIVTGIAGHTGFTSINISKSMMNSELGFGRKVLSVLEQCGISFEHIPSGIDTMSLVIADNEIQGKLEKLLNKLREAVNPDKIDIHSGLALIATVGQRMADRPGTAAKLFSALAASNVNIRMIDQGSSEMNIIVAVELGDYEKAINAIYHAFF